MIYSLGSSASIATGGRRGLNSLSMQGQPTATLTNYRPLVLKKGLSCFPEAQWPLGHPQPSFLRPYPFTGVSGHIKPVLVRNRYSRSIINWYHINVIAYRMVIQACTWIATGGGVDMINDITSLQLYLILTAQVRPMQYVLQYTPNHLQPTACLRLCPCASYHLIGLIV